MKLLKLLPLLFLFFAAACSTLVLQPADFNYPVESVISIGDDGIAMDERYSLSFNTKQLFFDESGDSLAYVGKELRMIRNTQGYYFITSKNFKNVYVFSVDESALNMKSKILISETGIQNPAFNQRNSYIELMDGSNKTKLTSEGIESEEQK